MRLSQLWRGVLAVGIIGLLLAIALFEITPQVGRVSIESVTWTLLWADPANSTNYSFPHVWGSCFDLVGQYNSSSDVECAFWSRGPTYNGSFGPIVAVIGNVSVTPPFAIEMIRGAPACENCQGLAVWLALPWEPGTYALTGQLRVVLRVF